MPRVAKQSEGTDNAPDRGRCGGVEEGEAHMEERMMDVIVEIYNHMDDSDKDALTLEDAEDMMEDQIRMMTGMRKKMTGTKRTTTRKKTTKPEKHTGLAGNGGPFLLP